MPSCADQSNVAAVVLVGGRSLRMGRPKATLALAGRALLAHVLGVVRPLVREIVLVAAADQALPVDLAVGDPAGARVPVHVVHDRLVAAGPLPALALGLAAVTAPLALALPCDAPFVQAALLVELVRRLAAPDAIELDAVVPTWDGHVQPLVAAYRPRIASRLDALVARGETRLQAVVGLPRVARIPAEAIRIHDPDGRSFRVLNAPADLAAAERLLAESSEPAPRR